MKLERLLTKTALANRLRQAEGEKQSLQADAWDAGYERGVKDAQEIGITWLSWGEPFPTPDNPYRQRRGI